MLLLADLRSWPKAEEEPLSWPISEQQLRTYLADGLSKTEIGRLHQRHSRSVDRLLVRYNMIEPRPEPRPKRKPAQAKPAPAKVKAEKPEPKRRTGVKAKNAVADLNGALVGLEVPFLVLDIPAATDVPANFVPLDDATLRGLEVIDTAVEVPSLMFEPPDLTGLVVFVIEGDVAPVEAPIQFQMDAAGMAVIREAERQRLADLQEGPRRSEVIEQIEQPKPPIQIRRTLPPIETDVLTMRPLPLDSFSKENGPGALMSEHKIALLYHRAGIQYRAVRPARRVATFVAPAKRP